MRQVILDTETTGFEPKKGHRIIEIGCVEMIDRQLTGKHYHVYVDPEREIDEGALAVHGISNQFLLGKPKFAAILQDFYDYIKGAELIIHNAPFDVGFINHEFKLANADCQDVNNICSVFDSLVYARKKHPGQRNSLDALCSRYGIDNSNRELHGALLDAEILALVYLAMTGGQKQLFAEDDDSDGGSGQAQQIRRVTSAYKLKVQKATAEELKAHQAFVDS